MAPISGSTWLSPGLQHTVRVDFPGCNNSSGILEREVQLQPWRLGKNCRQHFTDKRETVQTRKGRRKTETQRDLKERERERARDANRKGAERQTGSSAATGTGKGRLKSEEQG